MATKAKLHGQPLTTAREVKRMLAAGPTHGQSRRAWGREVLALVRQLADTNVEPAHFGSILPHYMAEAVGRERQRKFLVGCGVAANHGLPVAA